MYKNNKKITLFGALYKKLILYTILVAIAIYGSFLIFSRAVIYHDTHIMEYLTTKNLETILSTFDKLTLKEEKSTEEELLNCLANINSEQQLQEPYTCRGITQIVLTPSGNVVASNNPAIFNVSFADYPFFDNVINTIKKGNIASPRAFIPGLSDTKTFYKFIFVGTDTGNILALGKPLDGDLNLKMILKSSITKITSDIDIIKSIDVIYPNNIYSPPPDELKKRNIQLGNIAKLKDTITTEEHFLMLPKTKTLIAVWLTSIPTSSRADIVYIPQPYIIYMTLDFSKLLREFALVILIITLGVITFIITSGITAYLVTKNITADMELITTALEEWREVDKHSPKEIKSFLEHLHKEHFTFSSNIYEIEKLTETFSETIKDLLESQQQLVHQNILLEDAYKELEEKQQILKRAYYFFARRLAKLAEQFDNETGEHIVRVGEYSAFIAEKLGLSDEFIEDIRRFAPLHDIGKILVPQRILHKPGPLTPEEWEIMKKHTIYGWEILGGEEEGEMEMAKNIARYHHEKYDGSGYPDSLKGEEIPIEARIVSLADVYDALRSERPYKKAFSHDKVVSIILHGDGRVMPYHFDPQILEIFKRYHEVFDEIYRNNQ